MNKNGPGVPQAGTSSVNVEESAESQPVVNGGEIPGFATPITQTAQERKFWSKCDLYVLKHQLLDKATFQLDGTVRATRIDAPPVTAKDAVSCLYGILTTLDAKASALMRLSGVTLAAATFLLGAHQNTPGSLLTLTNWDVAGIMLVAALSAISIFLCLLVVRVGWNFLYRVGAGDNYFDYTAELIALQKTAHRRQMYYRCGWRVAWTAAVIFVVEFVWQCGLVLSQWISLWPK